MRSRKADTVVTCGWCGGRIQPKSRGPLPTWCSPTCRHRAWEQRRAAASGRSAVGVVDRRVELEVPTMPSRRDWPTALKGLEKQLDDGHIYDRDLPDIARALTGVLAAFDRRWTIVSPQYGRRSTERPSVAVFSHRWQVLNVQVSSRFPWLGPGRQCALEDLIIPGSWVRAPPAPPLFSRLAHVRSAAEQRARRHHRAVMHPAESTASAALRAHRHTRLRRST